jgi:ferrous iron transport protein A
MSVGRLIEMKLRLSRDSDCKTLAEVGVGQRVRVIELHVEGLARRRLLDLGLLPGTEVTAVMRSPLGTPMAYDIRGSMLALRPEDTSKITVKLLRS